MANGEDQPLGIDPAALERPIYYSPLGLGVLSVGTSLREILGIRHVNPQAVQWKIEGRELTPGREEDLAAERAAGQVVQQASNEAVQALQDHGFISPILELLVELESPEVSR